MVYISSNPYFFHIYLESSHVFHFFALDYSAKLNTKRMKNFEPVFFIFNSIYIFHELLQYQQFFIAMRSSFNIFDAVVLISSEEGLHTIPVNSATFPSESKQHNLIVVHLW